jgi:hypothetical protein
VEGLLPRARSRASPAPTTEAAPDPFPGGGGSGPLRPVRAVRPVEVWPPHVAAPDLPRESGSVGGTREHPCPHGHVEAPDL